MKALHSLILLSAFAFACGDRLVSTDEIPVDPLCMHAGGTMGYRLDGSRGRVHDRETDRPYACACITEEQFWDEAEIARLSEQLEAELLLECERVAAQLGFDWNDCQIDHDTDVWHAYMADEIWAPDECPGDGWVAQGEPYEPPFMCDLGDPGCSCTVEAACTGGSVCIDGMCQTPP
jgi:hypothetical protein